MTSWDLDLLEGTCLLEYLFDQARVQGAEVSVTREAMNLRALMLVVSVLALSSSAGVSPSGCDGEKDCADASDLLQIHPGESPIDGQLNRTMQFAQVAQFAQHQKRSLLSQRFSLEPAETGSCKQCACEFIANADKCGQKLTKSIEHCGAVEKCVEKTVKSMTKCIKYLAKGIVTSKWNGKHCKIKTKCYKDAKECMVPQSCFEAVPLADCLTKLGSKGGEAAHKAVQALKSLGDIKAKQMENAVMTGLDYSWNLLQKAWGFTLPGMVKDLLEKDGLWRSMEDFIDGAWDLVKSVGDDMVDFLKAVVRALKRAVKGPMSLPRTAKGKYVMLPYTFIAPWFTDCGFFQQWGKLAAALAKIYNPSLWNDIGKAYEGMGKALLKCGMLTTDIPVAKGITLKQPTPFMTMQKVSMTLSKEATDVAEDFLNLMYHAADEVEDLVKLAIKGIDKLSDYVSNLVFKNLHLLQDNEGKSLLQLAPGVSPKQLGKGGLAALQSAGACPGYNSTQNHVNTQNYAWMIRVQGSVGADLTKFLKLKGAGGIGVYLGCRCGKFRAVPFRNARWASLDVGLPPGDEDDPKKYSAGVDVQLKWCPHKFPSFVYGMKTEASVQINGGIKEGKVKGTLRTSLAIWDPKGDFTSKHGWGNNVFTDFEPPSCVGFTLAGEAWSKPQSQQALLQELHSSAKETWELTGGVSVRMQTYFCLCVDPSTCKHCSEEKDPACEKPGAITRS